MAAAVTTRYRPVREMSRSQRFQEEEEEEEENDDDHLASTPSCWQYLYMCCFDMNQFRLEMDRWNQVLVKEDLDRQHALLISYIDVEKGALAKEEDKFNARLNAVRKTISNRVSAMGTTGFTRSDVQKKMTTDEQIELSHVESMEKEVKRRRVTLQVLMTYLINIDKLRTESKCVLHDMTVMGMLDNVNKVTKSTRGIDVRQYSAEMCDKLHEISEQLGSMSLVQQRLMEVDLAKGETLAMGQPDKDSALDMLFREACRQPQQVQVQVQQSTKRAVRLQSGLV